MIFDKRCFRLIKHNTKQAHRQKEVQNSANQKTDCTTFDKKGDLQHFPRLGLGFFAPMKTADANEFFLRQKKTDYSLGAGAKQPELHNAKIKETAGVFLAESAARQQGFRTIGTYKLPESYNKSADFCSLPSPLANKPHELGLLHYRKWWELAEVEIFVNGKVITGTPIFVDSDTLRVVTDDYSYFIPLEKVDYIRTSDGLKSSFE